MDGPYVVSKFCPSDWKKINLSAKKMYELVPTSPYILATLVLHGISNMAHT